MATGVNVNEPFALTTIVPTPGIVAGVPAVNVPDKPATVNWVTVNAAAVDPEPESLVKTFPLIGVSSGVLTLSLIMVTLFAKIKRAAFVVKLPQAKLDCEICNL